MKKVAIVFLSILLIFSCSSDNNANQDPVDSEMSENQDPDPDPVSEDGDLKIADNVVVISDDISNLVSSDTDLENGIYKIEYTGSVLTVAVDDIIVGDEDEGFLRKVNVVSVSGNTQTLETEQATLEDVFENADLSFDLDLTDLTEVSGKGHQMVKNELIIDYLAEGVSVENTRTFKFNLDAVDLSSGGLSFKVSGGAEFNPNFNVDASIRGFRIQTVDFEANNSELQLSAGYEFNSAASVSVNNTVRLVRFRKRNVFIIGSVPVVVTTDVRLDAGLKTTLDAGLTAKASYNKTYTVDTGINFANGQWTGRFNSGQSTSIDPLEYSGAVNLTEVLSLTPNVQFKFYGVVAPFVEPELFAQYKISLNSNLDDWDSQFDLGLNMKMGIKALIFGRTLLDFDRTGTISKSIWNAPTTLEVVSGNNQEGDEEESLEEPLKLIVKDNFGNPLQFVPVHVKLVQEDGSSSSSGSINEELVETNEEGIAEFIWTLGKASDEEGTKRFAEFSIRNSEAKDILDEPIKMEAEINSKILKIVSGNNQKEDAETTLPAPLVVQVTNSNDEPVADEEVFIELIDANGNPSNSGSIDPASAVTDAQGMAEFTWTLGKEDDEEGNKRFAEATIKDEDGNEIEQDEPVIFEAEINPETGCGSFVDLSLFTATECGQVFNINEVLVSAEQTTTEDCAAGACSFGDFQGGIGAFPARILFDISNYQDLTAVEILLKYTDFCGSGCTKAFVYDENNVQLASLENTAVSTAAEFKFTDPNVLTAARFVAFSSCEGALTCFDMTFE